MASMTPDKVKSLLGDLGKPTMRGIRKCPKCGTFNGTRGISCKNKMCDAVFKESDRRKGHSAEAVKIITGSNAQVYSVRLRDRGPDYRGFVQLPLVQDLEGNPTDAVDPAIVASAARCYVETCNRGNQPAFEPCPHVKAAIGCHEEATPLTLKNSVLNSLEVSNDIKQAIWLLATETTGPLVQRVTKNIMVVKCKPNGKQPLGFLHFAFFETARNRNQPEHKFQCSCKSFRAFRFGNPKEENQKRCVHFYACVCAFASDEKLSEEFSYYINLDANSKQATPQQHVISIIPHVAEDDQSIAVTTEPETVEVVIDEDEILAATEAKKIKLEDSETPGTSISVVQASDALLTLQESGGQIQLIAAEAPASPERPIQQITIHTTPAPRTPKKPSSNLAINAPVDESTTQVSFHQWLASVTERINQTMHYQFDGNPDPLVFHAAQVFFDCLQQRISTGNKKKRLPNATTGFVRRDALPLGTFTKYTWQITNILHIKQIFDTPEMPLELTRSFVENRDGTFDVYEPPKVDENSESSVKGKNQHPIRPFELKTYLKVGLMTPEQKEPTPFIIEWIPDILPKSRIGELRIKFEYGHQRNGHIVHRKPVALEIAV